MKRPLTGLLLVGALSVPTAAFALPEPDSPPASNPSSAPNSDLAPEDAPISKMPTLQRAVDAVYPPDALRDRVEATVPLWLDIDRTGRVVDAGLVTTATISRTSFVMAAIAAARQLELTPAEAAGVPVPVRITYTFNFRLPDPQIVLQGVVREVGTRRRIAGALVTITKGEDAFEATTDGEGLFELFDLAEGVWSVQIEHPGHLPDAGEERIVEGQLVSVEYFLQPADANPFDVVVRGEAVREVTARSLSTEEILRVPGTLGDPVLVVENLPGVARSGAGEGTRVRGSAPADTGLYVEGTELLVDQHVGGLRSVIAAGMVERVDFYPGNFSVRYGRQTGGIVDVQLKDLNPDQVHGSLDISLLDAALYVETPIGDNAAIAFAGRRSYIDFLLQAAVPDDADVGLVTAPRYYDYQMLATWRPSPAHRLRLFALGSDDRMELVFADAADIDPRAQSDSARSVTTFQRVALHHAYTPNTKIENRVDVAFGRDDVLTEVLGQFQIKADFLTFRGRDLLTWRPSRALRLSAGVDIEHRRVDYDVRAPRPPREGAEIGPAETFLESSGQGVPFTELGALVEAGIEIGALTLTPGLRVDHFSYARGLGVDPRIVARWAAAETVTLEAGAGLVHQAPELDETDAVFGNPDLGIMRAAHYTAGVEWRPLRHLLADVSVFYKDLDNVVSRTANVVQRDGSDVPQVYDNEGRGRVVGAEVLLRHELAHNLSGWLSYTVSRAERTDSGASDARLFDHDQTHLLSLVASYRLPRQWSLGLRWRLSTGRPVTPLTGGVFRSDLDLYEPVAGAPQSERLPAFHQLDLRVDKRWVFDHWSLGAYLSVTNVYNRRAVNAVTYNFDYTETESSEGLPVYPILGVKGEF